MNMINYEGRGEVYDKAAIAYGIEAQLIVALEELSEAQKEICKMLRGKGDIDHLAEEIADATIMLEQVRRIYDINEQVCSKMDEKVVRLLERVKADCLKQGVRI